MDTPETYGLPKEQNAHLPSRRNRGGYLGSLLTAVLGVVAGLVAFRQDRMNGLQSGKAGGEGRPN